MSTSIQLPESVSRFMRGVFAHYAIISVVLAILTLIYCVYTIQNTMSIVSDKEYQQAQQQKNTRTSFDTNTIEKVEQLRTRDDTDAVRLPEGRINPFSE